MPLESGDRRLLLVHAHPDDESIGQGATMARYAAEGAGVTLVTCTLGELGEIIPAGLAHLAADREDRLGEYRIGELAAACAALGVTDHRFLGGPGRWRDSGMMGTPGNSAPGCFWQADVDQAAAELAAVIRDVRPQVMVSYDADG
ncbi:MAG TPA: N-acetyl-1-D-myo-inositol-2-amino-2-deoxy-alpha-D-glucopyranoside deacetylase, partial [Streptosporangiaceae bacterium]